MNRLARKDPASEAFNQGLAILRRMPLFAPLEREVTIFRDEARGYPDHGWATVHAAGVVTAHPRVRLEAEEWVYVLGHVLLHLGLGQVREHAHPRLWNLACCAIVDRMLKDFKVGRPPQGYEAPEHLPSTEEEKLLHWLQSQELPEDWKALGMSGEGRNDISLEIPNRHHRWEKFLDRDWGRLLAVGLQTAVEEAVQDAAGYTPKRDAQGKPIRLSSAERAKRWFVGAYPLLGALAVSFTLVEDPLVCIREHVSIAAVCPESREIFLNPAAALGEQECRFVLAHEILHVGLRHAQRREGRDPYLWNVACDFVINGWLVEMELGHIPRSGLHDPELKGLSAEAVYDRIVRDMRRFRKLGTFRGEDVDILERSPGWYGGREATDLDAFYRRALNDGLALHQASGRGYLPAGLMEEIRALSQPPIPWEVELAQWFDGFFTPLERRRSYARPSRRQSATPDIPRPRVVTPEEALRERTFGVLLDTSGSMDRHLLAKGLGAIASYCYSRDVPFVRLVFCDAAAYDEGYVSPETIAERVRIRGRGGTVLQPGIELLEKAEDFPKKGPILIITDGECDTLHLHRDHAYLMPQGKSLPFPPRGPVFRVK